MKKVKLPKMHEAYTQEELKLALDVLSDLELETGNDYHEPMAELERIIIQDY